MMSQEPLPGEPIAVADMCSPASEQVVDNADAPSAVRVPPLDGFRFHERKDWDGREHWNLAQFLAPSAPLNPVIVARVVKALLSYHDALRRRTALIDGEYYYVFPAPTDHDPVPFTSIDLSDVPADAQPHVLEQHAIDYQARLNLIHGPMLQVTLFDLDQQGAQRLLVLISHSVCDGYSFQLFMNDFASLYAQIVHGLPPVLPPKTTSFKTMIERQWAYAESPEFAQELAYWRGLRWDKVQPLPMDFPDQRGTDIRASLEAVTVSLSIEETAVLQRRLPKLKATMLDLLLTALQQTLTRWTGVSTQAFFLLHHGRVIPIPEVKLARTIGNIFSCAQIILEAEETQTSEAALRAIQEQVRQIPYNGVMWRWLPLEMTGRSDMAFNYMGQVHTQEQESATWLRYTPDSVGPVDDMQSQQWVLLSFITYISDRQLVLRCEYSQNLYHHATIEQFAHAYMDVLRTFLPA